MNRDLSSTSIEPVLSGEPPRTSSCNSNDSAEGNTDGYLTLSPAKSSKTIKICTLCGRYKGFRMRRHVFIALCIMIVLLILLLGILVVLYAVVPEIIRSLIAKAKLDFHSVNIEQIENDRFHLRAQLELSHTGSLPASILPPLIIHVDDVGIVVHNESISITGDAAGATIIPISSPFIVSDMKAFRNFSRSLIFEPNVVWHLKAKATIRPISRHMLSYSHIPFNKEVTLGALNRLPNVSIDSLSLIRSDAHRVLIDLIIKITNPSIFSIDLGQLYFSLQYNNWSIGYVESTSDNITIHPSENAIQFFGELQSSSLESYVALSTVIQNFLTGQTSKVEALAGPNATSYPLLAAGIIGLSLNVDMPPFNQQLIVSLIFNSMSLIPSTNKKTVMLSASITIKINSPLGQKSPLNIQMMNMSVFLLYKNDSVGMLDVSQAPVKQLDIITYESEFNNKYLSLTDTGATYEKFTQNFISANKTHLIDFRVVGVASIVGSFALGSLSIDGITVENNVSLVGLDGLNNVQVDSISIDGEEEAALRLSINATINNPGVTEVQLRNFSLHMAEGENGTILGQIPIDVLAIRPGNNSIALNGLLAPSRETDLPVIGKFFSAYLNGETQQVTLFHDQSSVQNATAMDLTISGLSMKANLDGIETELIRQVNVLNFGIEFDSVHVNKVYITGQLSVLFELPSNVHMTFRALRTSINFTIRLNDELCIGQMILRDLPVEHNQTTNELFMSFNKQELIVLNDTLFKEFAANLVLTTNVSIVIQGLAAALAEVRIGNITLSDIPINDTLHLVGYNQFDNGLLNIDNIDIIGAISSRALALQIRTQIINPSVVNILNGGLLSLDLCDIISGKSLGLVNIDPFYLQPQGNITILDAEGIFNITEQNAAIAQEFISHMISGIDNQVELRGRLEDNSTGTSIPLLSLAIAGLRIHTRVPGLSGEKTLVPEIILKKLTAAEIFGIPLGLVKTLLTRIRLVNPFSTPLVILNMYIRADFGPIVDEDLQVGIVNYNTPLTIDSHQELITPYLTVQLSGKLSTMVALLGPLLAGSAYLSLSGNIDVSIGGDFILTELPLTVLNVTTDQEHSR
ncbi:unnamed protein product [Rotaria sp. Silwood1]|nr:unnamed protein product [Rotaria sp. Silwood1]CAF1647104.1 unnamed protein product [Rotaria sp. Silwood1]CAF3796669.1 unnamed protein product [Rotaria sp. Silwood1]CAF4884427.1 unnamed protein product [Rotaria sp. Silwood1]